MNGNSISHPNRSNKGKNKKGCGCAMCKCHKHGWKPRMKVKERIDGNWLIDLLACKENEG